ncbi:MAG: ATP-dependent Clp protease proteolytic subunit [Verrucomicrobiota bacterium]
MRPYLTTFAVFAFTLTTLFGEESASVGSEPIASGKDVAENPSTKDANESIADDIAASNRLFDEKLKQELQEERAILERLKIEYELRQQRLKNDLQETELEVNRLQNELAVLKARSERETAELAVERESLQAKLQLAEQKLKNELAEKEAEKMRMSAERSFETEQFKSEMAELELVKQRLALENQKRAEELKGVQLQAQAAMQEIDLESKRLSLEKIKWDIELSELNTELQRRQKEESLRVQIGVAPEYPDQPFQDGVLSISDRRIPLDGPIMTGTADFVSRRIDFFNNQDPEAPIFIVINSSPGGSVMEGYRIMKSIESSDAPIHVVVKSFAASMAAVITTIAEQSYAYPNAILLHHQPFGVSFGNLTEQNEQVDVFEEWARRLHGQVVDKMGISLEEFYERMYEENSRGDWEEFADVAQELSWVDHIVTEVREEGILKKPTDSAPQPFYWFFFSGEAGAEDLVRARQDVPDHVILPRPQPYDFYFMHDPHNFYRWQ